MPTILDIKICKIEMEDEKAPAPSASECRHALAEVNATRAKRHLPAFVHDPQLDDAAYACAKVRAQYLCAGHTRNDFAGLAQGVQAKAAGCAAWTPDWGWGACCTYDRYTYAGAAWVMGRDGKRYMHLFVR